MESGPRQNAPPRFPPSSFPPPPPFWGGRRGGSFVCPLFSLAKKWRQIDTKQEKKTKIIKNEYTDDAVALYLYLNLPTTTTLRPPFLVSWDTEGGGGGSGTIKKLFLTSPPCGKEEEEEEKEVVQHCGNFLTSFSSGGGIGFMQQLYSQVILFYVCLHACPVSNFLPPY